MKQISNSYVVIVRIWIFIFSILTSGQVECVQGMRKSFSKSRMTKFIFVVISPVKFILNKINIAETYYMTFSRVNWQIIFVDKAFDGRNARVLILYTMIFITNSSHRQQFSCFCYGQWCTNYYLFQLIYSKSFFKNLFLLYYSNSSVTICISSPNVC